ncbi:MAG: DUF4167 domain-containing protein [Pseudomonadota bacterium]
MTNSGEKLMPIPPVPVQPRTIRPQSKTRAPGNGPGRFPNNRRGGNNQGKGGGGSGRSNQRRNQASDQYNKYLNLAKDATAAGDYIAAETYNQHADHYYRVMNPVPTA